MAEVSSAKQVLICGSPEQLARAQALFPRLEARYLNGADWATVEGRRVVCMGRFLAEFAMGYAAECVVLPDDFPEDFGDETPIQWAKRVRVPYNELVAQHSAPQAMTGEIPPSPVNPPLPPAGAEPASAEQEPAHLQAGAADTPPESVKVQGDGRSSPFLPSPPPPATAEPSETAQDAPEPPEGWEAQYSDEDAASATVANPGWIPPQSEHMGIPADLWGHDEALPVMPADCYPEAIAQFVAEEAEVMGCDPGMLALYCTAVCAGAITDEIRVQVKAASDRWQESARAWLMIVGDSGLTMKSPTLDVAMSHAWKIEREMRVNGGAALKEYETERQIYEAQRAEYVKKRAKGEPAEPPIEPPLPIAERLIVGNATLEAIGDVLLQQGGRGVLVRADELLGIISGMNQYKGGKGSDRAEWLEMWNGGPHPIDRKGRAVLVKNWGASIVGGTQPEAIARVGQGLETDGLLQRFTIYCPRYSTRGVDAASSREARSRYHNVLDRLVKLIPQPDLAPVRFSPEAVQVIEAARTWIMDTARAGWMPAGLRSHLAKWPAMLARYCLTYAAIEAADENHAAIPAAISGRIAEQVWTMMRGTLWPHAEHFYLNTLNRGTGNISAVRQVAGLILSDGMREITSRTMHQRSTLYRVAHPTVRREIISTLCELGWIVPKGGKSQITGLPTQYRVNEAVHVRFPHIREKELSERAARTQSWNEARAARARQPGED